MLLLRQIPPTDAQPGPISAGLSVIPAGSEKVSKIVSENEPIREQEMYPSNRLKSAQTPLL